METKVGATTCICTLALMFSASTGFAHAQSYRDNGLKTEEAPKIELGFHFVSISEWDGSYVGFGEETPANSQGHLDAMSNGTAVPQTSYGLSVRTALTAEPGPRFEIQGLDWISNKTLPNSALSLAGLTPDESYVHATKSSSFNEITNLVANLNFSDTLRVEAEVSYLQHDVDVFRSFGLDNQDFGDQLRTTDILSDQDGRDLDLENIVINGRGRVETKATFANGFFDMPIEKSSFLPYFGAGVGVAEVDIDYAPDGISLVNDKDTVFAYQLMMGAEYKAGKNSNMVLNARYRGLEQSPIENQLLPQGFQVEDSGFVGEIGFRRDF